MTRALVELSRLVKSCLNNRQTDYTVKGAGAAYVSRFFDGVPPTEKETAHSLKTWPEEFTAMRCGEKWFEFRFYDRPFQVGDVLILCEYDPIKQEYSGEKIYRRVIYIMRGKPEFGLSEKHCVMSLSL